MEDLRTQVRVVVVFASQKEADPFLKKVSATLLDQKPYALYEFSITDQTEKGLVLISGIGKVASEVSMRYVCIRFKPRSVINAGLVGVLLDESLVGELVQVDSVIDFNIGDTHQDERVLAVHDGPWDEVMPLSLVTVNKPLVDQEIKKSLLHKAHIVDMEGFGIAQVCIEFEMPIMMLKIVSDVCNEQTSKDFFKRLPELSQKLGERLCTSLVQF